MHSSSDEIQSFNEMIKGLRDRYSGKGNQKSTPDTLEPSKSDKKRMDEFFDEYIASEQKKGTLTDKRYNSICDQLSIRLGWDFSNRKITAETKLFRDARMRADSVRKEVETEQIESHSLQRLFFTAFSPLALDIMIKHSVKPAGCAIYSTLALNCIIKSGLAYMSKYDIIERLNLSHTNSPLYFNELLHTGLIVDSSNHSSRKETTRFYLPHTHQYMNEYLHENEHDNSDENWILITPEAVEILASEKGLTGTHWYVYAYFSMNTYRVNGVTIKALPKKKVAEELNLGASRRTMYYVFEKLQELGLIIEEKHKKDVYFLPHILRKYTELAVKNGEN